VVFDNSAVRNEYAPSCAKRLVITGLVNYAHEQTWRDGNGHSHLQATLLGPSLTVPVRDGRPVLGAWPSGKGRFFVRSEYVFQ
jgi:hypothetical protein